MVRFGRQFWSAVLGAAVLSGCLGTSENSVFNAGENENTAGGGGGSSSLETQCTVDTVGPQTLRRLNRYELARSLESLLGSSTGVNETLPSDDSVLFDNDADAMSVSPALVEKYDGIFTTLIDRALLATGGTGARSRILTCTPTAGAEATCARTVLQTFANNAWRRTATKDEVDSLVGLYSAGRSAGETFEPAVALSLRATLLSPNFLFRIEQDGGNGIQRVDPEAFATRLSYFIWSSPPDAELLTAARDGRLTEKADIEAQVRRMMRDPKSKSLTESFGAQWLGFRFFDSLLPSNQNYPGFTEGLRTSMSEEAKRYFGSFLAPDKSFLDIMDSKTTFVDERLAAHYGIAGVTGTDFREVQLPASRVGLLTQAAYLMVGSTPTRGSPSKRGHHVLDRLLCRPPPPPPPNIALTVDAVDTSLPMRDRLVSHRANPSCAACHAEMDPIGLAYEHFDGIGSWRDDHNGHTIVTAGKLPNGSAFEDAQALAGVLKGDPYFAHCVTEQVFSYAMGRAARQSDSCAVDDLVEKFAVGGYRFEDLVVATTLSAPFLSRQAQER